MSKISAKYHKDFKNSEYHNPRLTRESQTRQKKQRKFWLILSGLIVIGLFYFLFFSSVFRLQAVEVSGLSRIKPESINKIIDDYRYSRVELIFSRNNFWLFRRAGMEAKLLEQYYFESFKLSKKWPNKILINLKEKESATNWQTNNLCYHLDQTGVAIEFCENNQGLLTIKDVTERPLKIGESALGALQLKYIVNLDEQLQRLGKDFKIMVYEKQGNSLTVKTWEGVEFLFNTNLELGPSISRLEVLLNQPDIKGHLSQIKYIDLRFGEKIYYQ